MNLLSILIILLIHLHFTQLVTCASSLDNQGNNDVDRNALLAIKSEISDDPQGVLNSWNDSLHFCHWQGVTCGFKPHQRRRVVSLDLTGQALVGTLSPSVGNLSFLHQLYLSNNSFKGHIPPQIGRLFRLRHLWLANNSFQGEIPTNISRSLKLKSLFLIYNNLTGTIPSELSVLSNMETLGLQNNRLTGNLLNIVVNMTYLRTLSAAVNFFQGSIPDNIGQLQRLHAFDISHNDISGRIPPSFFNMSSLKSISLGHNRLEGSLPLDFGFRFPQLTTLAIPNNSFQGKVPFSLSNLTQLKHLSIYSNKFTGEFKFTAENMPNLRDLDVSDNYLGTGAAGDLSFLQTLVNCSHLYTLLCGVNNFGGSLPHFLGNMSSELVGINFADNQLTGSIPDGLFNLVNLQHIYMSENHLTGYLSPRIGQLTKLVGFICTMNNLIGKIPYSLGNLSKLGVLDLSNNDFEGKIPSSLGDCTNLLELYLYQNRLTGELPPHLFDATMLTKLVLVQNNLQGTIPPEVGQLRNVVYLYFHDNAFSGEIPSSLGRCIELNVLDMGGNFFTSSIPPSFKSLTSLLLLNLSHNKLSGQIPNFLSTLPLMELDLSFNNLEGEVPRNGAFANSSAVSVLGNSKLCGGVSELHLPRCPTRGSKTRRKLSLTVILAIAAACFVGLVSIVSSVYLIFFRRERKKLSQESWSNEPFPKVSYDMLLKATDGFSQNNLIGTGHFGSVYKATLDPESMVVAIKVISLQEKGASKSFMAECLVLRNIRHRNLVKIVTACSSTDFQGNDFKALVYEFMSNGNLQKWIHKDDWARDGQDDHVATLSLLQRLNIAIDVASALDYLHNSCENPIIHCDLKPSNILLDDDMVAHVGDFGLARFHPHVSTSNSSSVALRGTVGYAAPEYGLGSMVSKEGDVYSYGIILLEMMTAVRPTDIAFEGGVNLHQYAKAALPDQLTRIMDPMLVDDAGIRTENQDGNRSAIYECIKSVIGVGLKCSVESPLDRMSIQDAITELQSTRKILVGARRQHHSAH